MGKIHDFFTKQKEKRMFSKLKKGKLQLTDIEEQNECICLNAVQYNGLALKDVKNQTLKIALHAVKQNGSALQYAERQSSELCIQAIRNTPFSLQYVKNQTPEICLEAIKQYKLLSKIQQKEKNIVNFMDTELLKNCNSSKLSDITAFLKIKNSYGSLNQLQEILFDKTIIKNSNYDSFATESVKQNGLALLYIPNKNKTEEVCLEAVKQNWSALKFAKQTPKVCLEAVKQNIQAAKYIDMNLLDCNGLSQAQIIEKLERMVQEENIARKIPENIRDEHTNFKTISSSARIYLEKDVTEKFKTLLKQNNLPFLPDKKGYCNVHAVKNAGTGYEFTGINQLIAKMYLHERGLDNDNVLTLKQVYDFKAGIKNKEKLFLSFYDSQKDKTDIAGYIAQSQVKHTYKIPELPEKLPSKEATFKQTSSDPLDYLTNYLDCIKQNRAFTADLNTVKIFKKNLEKELQKSPLRIYELAAEANKQIWCKTNDGVEWLKTEKGQAWLKTDIGKKWLKSERATNYFSEKSKENDEHKKIKPTSHIRDKHRIIER
ncbi:DUF4116 domain-containing protein [Treponema pedis]|uniref:DUF4116 domain-containing protein n=1 Tax=Treponema pedis TaxID=409322 RepID=UPI0003FDF03E|nr:DUF4116 domain-containing protein [Treponema pedis]